VEREVAHDMAVVKLVKMKAGQVRVSLPDALASVSSESRGKSAQYTFAEAERILHHVQCQHHKEEAARKSAFSSCKHTIPYGMI